MFKSFLRVVLKLLFRVELLGDPSEFANKRTLIVANHESFIDGLLIGGASLRVDEFSKIVNL